MGRREGKWSFDKVEDFRKRRSRKWFCDVVEYIWFKTKKGKFKGKGEREVVTMLITENGLKVMMSVFVFTLEKRRLMI